MMPFLTIFGPLLIILLLFKSHGEIRSFFTTYHPHKNIFHLTYMEHESTRVCYYINKQLTLSSWYVTHHSSDLCTIELQTSGLNILHIYNVYNPILSTNSSRCLSLLQEKIAVSPLEEHIILGDFNLHHPV